MFQHKASDLVEGFTLIEFLVSSSLSCTIIFSGIICYSHFVKVWVNLSHYSNMMSNVTNALYFLYTECHKPGLESFGKNEKNNLDSKAGTDILQLVEHQKNSLIHKYIYVAKATSGESALFQKEEGKPRVKLAGSIESLSVSYGICCETNQNICAYVSRSKLTEVDHVAAIFITLTASNKLRLPNNNKWNLYVALQ